MTDKKAKPAAETAKAATQTAPPKDRHGNKRSQRDQILGRKAA